MELILISENKLKVMLSSAEMEEYELSVSTFDAEKDRLRDSVKKVMSKIKDTVGFDATEEHAYIQLYPCRKGGCELYITKCCDEIYPADHEKLSQCELNVTDTCIARDTMYSFDNLEALLSLCRALSIDADKREADLYMSDDGIYMLKLYCKLTERERQLWEEFGQRETPEPFLLYMTEHWRRLCSKNAIKRLSNC